MKISRFKFLILIACLPMLGHTQNFYSNSSIREVRIELPYKNWDFKLDSIKKNNPDARLLGVAHVDGQYFDSIGVRYKGNSSYFRTRKETYKKLPFNIKLNWYKKNQKLSGDYTTIRLSNAFLDPSFIRDPLMYEVVRKYMPAPECNFSNLFINEKHYGLYINTESVDTVFLKKHFGVTNGDIIKCDPDNWKKTRSQTGCPKGENASLIYLNDSPGCYEAFYEVDDSKAWAPLLKLIKVLNKTPDKIETVLNIDQTLWMHALNNVMVNLDSYTGSLSHNYYLWIDSTGVSHPIMWDFNMAFGGWRRDMSFELMTDEQLILYSPLAELDNKKRPLISNVLKNPLYRKVYLAHFKTIVNEFLANGELLKYAENLTRQIESTVRRDTMKLYSDADFKNALDKTMTSGVDKVIGIRELMDARSKWLVRHPLLQKVAPKIIEKQAVITGEDCLVTAKLEGAKSAHVCFRTAKPFAFSRISMRDDGLEGDATAADGVFSVKIPAAKIRHFYLIGENDDAVVTLPEHSGMEFFEVK